jgi:hypothetical protein
VGPRADLNKCEKSCPPTGIRSPDRPARSQLLYRLSYRGLQSITLASMNNELPEDGVTAPKRRRYFNANFNIFFKTITCAFVIE